MEGFVGGRRFHFSISRYLALVAIAAMLASMATVARAATISGTIDLPAGVSPTGNLQVFVRLTDTARYDSGSPFNTTEDEGSAEELAGGSGHAGIDIRVGSTLPDVSPICFPVPAGTGGDGVICL